MPLFRSMILCLTLLSLLQAGPVHDTAFSFEYRGFEDNRHIFITNHDKSDSIGIVFNAGKEIRTSRESVSQSFRIRLSELRDGLHTLGINYYGNGILLEHKKFSFFKEKERIILKRSFLWISRFDFAHLISRKDFSTQADYSQRIQEILSTIIINASKSGITDIIFQVRGSGDVFYKSAIEPFSHLLSLEGIIGEDPGWDPLEFAVSTCRRHNLQIHAWINTFPIEHQQRAKLAVKNSIILPVRKLGPLLAKDRNGNLPSSKGYIFLHPAHRGTYEYIIKILDELIKNYDLDGIHFDYFRLDSSKYIYNEEIQEEYNSLDVKSSYEAFIKDRINEHLKGFSEFIKSGSSDITVSVAVIGKMKGTGFSAENHFQDPAMWLNENLVDLIFPMTYYFPQSIEHMKDYITFVKPENHPRIIPGIGAYLTLKREKNHPFSYITNSYNVIYETGNFGGTAFFSGESLETNRFWGRIKNLILN